MSVNSKTFDATAFRNALVNVYGVREGGGFFVKCGLIITTAQLLKERQPIWVQVRPIKDDPKSYLYAAKLRGWDLPSDIAVLQIDMKMAWNSDLPEIQSAYLRFGSNRCLTPGNSIYLATFDTITSGIVQNNQGITSVWESVDTNLKG